MILLTKSKIRKSLGLRTRQPKVKYYGDTTQPYTVGYLNDNSEVEVHYFTNENAARTAYKHLKNEGFRPQIFKGYTRKQ